MLWRPQAAQADRLQVSSSGRGNRHPPSGRRRPHLSLQRRVPGGGGQREVIILFPVLILSESVPVKDGLDLGRGEEGAQEPGVDPGPGGLAEVWRPRRVLRPRVPLHREVTKHLPRISR